MPGLIAQILVNGAQVAERVGDALPVVHGTRHLQAAVEIVERSTQVAAHFVPRRQRVVRCEQRFGVPGLARELQLQLGQGDATVGLLEHRFPRQGTDGLQARAVGEGTVLPDGPERIALRERSAEEYQGNDGKEGTH
ncbi:MAG TPA: hypothetical protein PL002_11655 [Flavobacteriales bacterium]|nr:hypothetical protein [Flavobacteriales bacterium]